MRILVNSAAFLLATTGFVEAVTPGECLNWSYGSGPTLVSTYTGSTAAKVPWFVELTLSAVERAKVATPIAFTTIGDVATAGSVAYGTGGLLNGRIRNDQLTDGVAASTSFRSELRPACQTCILTYAQDVYNMYINGTLPDACQDYTKILNAGVPTNACLYGLSQAIANFDSCTKSTSTDLALGTAVNLASGGVRCNASQIADLEGRFGIYQNIMNYVLFGTFVDGDFQTAYRLLPCKDVFDLTIIGGISSTLRNTLRDASKCGVTAGTSQIFNSACTGATFTGTTSIAAKFAEWASALGGGVTIATDGSRCSSSEIAILEDFSVYDAMVQCSLNNVANTAGWADCLGNRWLALKDVLNPAAININKVRCFDCFQQAANAIYAANTVGLWGGAKCKAPATSFSSACIQKANVNGFIDNLYACSGLKMATTTTGGLPSDISAIPAEIKSIVPFVRLVRDVASDETLTGFGERLSSVLTNLGNVPMFANMSATAPFASCYGAMAMDLMRSFIGDQDLVGYCSDDNAEYSSGCVGASKIGDAIDRFEDCSGFRMLTTSPYNCTAAQFKLLTDSALPRYIYTQTIQTPGSTIFNILNNIMANVTAIQKANNVTLPCANCLEDVVTGLINLDDNVKKTCSAMDPSACLQLPAVDNISAKFAACSNQTFDVKAAIPVTTTNAPGTDSTTNDAPATSVFVSAVTIALSALLL